MEQQYQLTNTARLQISSNNSQKGLFNSSQLILLFNLYDNRFIHEKFLDQIFGNLIENKQMIRYDFQKKIYSLYPETSYSNLKIFTQLKALSLLSFIYILLKYIRYKKLTHENFIFFKIYFKTTSKIFHLRISLIFLLLRKNLQGTLMQLYKTYKKVNKMINLNVMLLTLNYLDYKVILNKKLSNTSYIAFYNSYTLKN